ncbi:7TM diverse intracellular signaling domain-containing protein [Flammeovirgaceae bacterium SG7u.111]|nr:7TM diverse intracellular signaling domain-containing protein [Flammeovirgaceae bacterium SG7u.132]WPO36839.1 7TM diverse intracellular signaling domain-containing protein [Flammeovirgaceae bacterium SG7u.111]
MPSNLFPNWLWFNFLVGFLLISANAEATDTIRIVNQEEMRIITSKSYFLEDHTGEMGISDILALENQVKFKPIGKDAYSTPATDAVIWFKFTIQNKSGSDLWLELGDPFSAWYLDFYSPDEEGNHSRVTYSVGAMRPESNKEFPSNNYCIPIAQGADAVAKTYYMKVKGGLPMIFVFQAGNIKALINHTRKYDYALALFFGVILSSLIYNLFLFISIRDTIYIRYISYLCVMLVVAPFSSGNPLSFHPFWWHYVVTWNGVLYLCSTLFAVEYLALRSLAPRLYSWVWFLTLVLIVLLPILEIFSLIDTISLNYIFQPIVYILFLSLLISGIYLWIKGQKNARFYVSGWVFFVVSLFVFALAINGVVPLNIFTRNALYIGASAEALLFSLALGDRYNILKKDNERVQAQNLALVEEQKIELETKVHARTKELQMANDELQASHEELQAQQEELQSQQEELSAQNEELFSTLDQLKVAQSQLVQSEKMASLGLLTAGLAHEINNPINFIKSAVSGLQGVIEQFSYFSDLYKKIDPDNAKKGLEEISDLKKELKFDEMMEKALRITSHIDTGANRTAEIVKGLQSYSRSNSTEYASYNIVDGINDTLLLLNHLFGESHIKVFKNFDKIPEVECSPGQLNQVLMNIFVNAIQSMKERGNLFISTYQQGANITIKIKDTGSGIPSENLKHIFDPFFTTKEVGEGTGLGLSIVKGIIAEHGGSIMVESVIDEGTTFEISLPITH